MTWLNPNPIQPDVAKLRSAQARLQQIIDYAARDKALFIEAAAKESSTEQFWAKVQSAAMTNAVFSLVKRAQIEWALLHLLQTHEMEPSDRRIIEKAAMLFSRSIKRRRALDAAETVAEYERTLAEYQLIADTFLKIIDQGRVIGSGLTAGTLTVINSGGFPDKTMQTVLSCVAEASSLLAAKGLDQILYGDIYAVNTIRRSSRVLAFYTIESDSLYIRANIPKAVFEISVDTVVHELAHRLHYKFFGVDNYNVTQLYRSLRHIDLERSRKARPAPGMVIVAPGDKAYLVLGWRPGRPGTEGTIELKGLLGPSPGRASMPMSSYLAKSGLSVFVSDYARKSPAENFAEMIRFYCRDRLSSEQLTLLKQVIG